MSEPKLISPLLDGYAMGRPVSDHDGVRCCPAMHTESANKYIVKIISIPASQVKLDALLLAGAFTDNQSALAYFKELSDGIVEEAELLQRLSKLEGFISFEGWQVVPMEDAVGYDVYLIGSYRPTLDRFMRRNPMTHLSAVNLGLDLCAALAVCRRCGYLYVDLKPGNIYICDDHEFRIGDLGFISLSSLPYASLPDKYRSVYTAPEITDAYSSLNTTLDIYAAGLILYQAYNNGALPFDGSAPAEPLPAPAYADYEMAEIILKACAPDPKDRWQDPLQMGQALVNYMQRNGANDTPIVPPVIPEPAEEPAAEEQEAAPAEEAPIEEAAAEATLPVEETPLTEEPEEEQINLDQFMAGIEDALGLEHYVEPEKAMDEDAPQQEAASGYSLEDIIPAEDLQVIHEILSDETLPSEESAADLEDAVLTEEATLMLAQADDLITHQIPEPVVAPEPIDVPVPAAAPVEDEPADEPAAGAVTEAAAEEADGNAETTPEETDETAEVSEEPEDEDDWEEEYDQQPAKKSSKKLHAVLLTLVAILVILLLFFSSMLFYDHYYLQNVSDLTVSGHEDYLTVSITSEIDNELLTVVCTDTYGNTVRRPLQNNTAVFTGLKPDTRYKVHLEISGFHKLTGVTSDYYTTPSTTSIVSVNTVAGPEDGSVILSFTVQGIDSQTWTVYYSAEDQAERSLSFSGHMVTVTGLNVGSEYTFRLEPADDLYLTGGNTVTYTATKIIYAENLTVKSFQNGSLTAAWDAPEGVTINSWTVRCYNNDGFEKTLTVTEPVATFDELSSDQSYTIEVTAEGMIQGTRIYVSADFVVISDIKTEVTKDNWLQITWDHQGTTPASGWHLLYSIDGSTEQHRVFCETRACLIPDPVPGAVYSITVLPANGNSAFNNTAEHAVSPAKSFSGYGITPENMTFSLCLTPESGDWTVDTLTCPDSFTAQNKVSLLIQLDAEYTASVDPIVTLFVIRNADGIPVSITTQSNVWSSMWSEDHGILNISKLPGIEGKYTLEVYFNSAAVTTQTFTIEAE